MMKSAYELAMERLSKSSPALKLTKDQKKRIAELEAEYKAKIADREIFLSGEMTRAAEKGDGEAMAQLEKQLASDRKVFSAALEEKKEAIRNGR